MELEIVTLSRQGGRDHNEDVCGHWNDGHYVACLVADGAGGHGGGDVAATITRQSILSGFAAAPALDAGLLHRLVMQANADIVQRQAEGGALANMRSTVVLAVVDLHADAVMWAHSGDSRAYLFRQGAIATRTLDHSLVQQMVAGGMLDAESARLHPKRNMLLSALGSLNEPPEVAISAPMQLEPADVLLLCSDGVWEVLGDEGLLAVLRTAASPRQWVTQLDEQIRERARTGHDNYTAVVLWATANDEQTRLLATPES